MSIAKALTGERSERKALAAADRLLEDKQIGSCRARRYAKGELAAVAIFGTPSKLPDGIIVLERGACAHWAHPHAASWFIPRAVKQAAVDHGWRIFFAYADPTAGEIGTVYQACNWIYTGQTPGRTIKGAPRPRDYFRRGGRVIESNGFYKQGFTIADVKSGAWRRVRKSAKHRYVWIEAPKKERRTLAARFTALPYPKRSGRISAGFQSGCAIQGDQSP